MNLHTWQIHATGSTCYDQTGITFPVKKWIPLLAEPHRLNGMINNPRWQHIDGLPNLPKVLVFEATSQNAEAIDRALEDVAPNMLLVTRARITDEQFKNIAALCDEFANEHANGDAQAPGEWLNCVFSGCSKGDVELNLRSTIKGMREALDAFEKRMNGILGQ